MVLALGEQLGASGKSVLDAFIVGMEPIRQPASVPTIKASRTDLPLAPSCSPSARTTGATVTVG
ncbi:MAG: hypothetical protein AAGB04_25805 [Pseudomonadota bacterium]